MRLRTGPFHKADRRYVKANDWFINPIKALPNTQNERDHHSVNEMIHLNKEINHPDACIFEAETVQEKEPKIKC